VPRPLRRMRIGREADYAQIESVDEFREFGETPRETAVAFWLNLRRGSGISRIGPRSASIEVSLGVGKDVRLVRRKRRSAETLAAAALGDAKRQIGTTPKIFQCYGAGTRISARRRQLYSYFCGPRRRITNSTDVVSGSQRDDGRRGRRGAPMICSEACAASSASQGARSKTSQKNSICRSRPVLADLRADWHPRRSQRARHKCRHTMEKVSPPA